MTGTRGVDHLDAGVLLAAGVGVRLASTRHSPAPTVRPPVVLSVHQGATAAGANPGTGVSGVALSRAGARTVIAAWFVPPVDFGGALHPAPLHIQGWTTIKTGDLARIDADRVTGGTTV